MKSTAALIWREFLEHRGAFFWAPAIILAILTLSAFSALTFGKMTPDLPTGNMAGVATLTLFEIGLLLLGALWMVYLMASLFFYYADAFSADQRNNALLFWKSMPVSDFRMLLSKFLAGLTLFPAIAFGAFILSALILYVLSLYVSVRIPGVPMLNPVSVAMWTWEVVLFNLTFLVLALLWYAPFFAWVGALSTVFRRWSIPLAFLVPGILGLIERLMFLEGGFRTGYIVGYLRERVIFSPLRSSLGIEIFSSPLVDGSRLLGILINNVDWPQLWGGLVAALVLVYLASEYRRRVVAM